MSLINPTVKLEDHQHRGLFLCLFKPNLITVTEMLELIVTAKGSIANLLRN